ncbi:methyltransferase [Psychromonas marina]|uniref:Methyltransferase n=1 Tax=Psychromonas marina TaxID=88364 RepID=A0ABQ6E262_9GAMM|nr:class I SAM-dependent methyltransferase [Psychromonas marina]GLS91457.1 methyltransferase [Psychromonas marina]
MSNEWDEYAASWATDPTVVNYASNAFAALNDNVDIDSLQVLDFGCGTGALTELMSPKVKQIVALDPASEMIKHLDKKALKNVFSIADYLTQELVDSQPELQQGFDLIVASSVCGFLSDYEKTLSLLTSLLKTGGVFVQWDWLATDERAATGLSEYRVKKAFENNGLTQINITTGFTMSSSKGLMPVLMAVAKKGT